MSGMAESAGVWYRVSSGGQDEANQVPDVERYCFEHGYRINKPYRLYDKSAYHGENEAALAEMLKDMKCGIIKVLVIWRDDRLMRSKGPALLNMVMAIHNAGGRIESVKNPDLGKMDIGSQITTLIQGNASYEYSLKISESVGIAHNRVRANQGLLGRAPFGYEITGDKYSKGIVPSALGLKYVPEIFNRIIKGDSLKTVAEWLNSEGVPTGTTKSKGWSATAVRQVIRNPAHKGQMRNRAGDLVGTCEAIVDAAVWRRANERLDSNPKRGPLNIADKVLLASALFCECGAPMYKSTSGPTRIYYRCSRGNSSVPDFKGKSCCMVRTNVVDGIVDESMSADHSEIMALTLIPGKNYEDELDLNKAQIKALTEDVDAPDYAERNAVLMAERQRLQTLDTTPDKWLPMPTGETYADKWTAADDAGKREMLKEWRVTFKWDEIDGTRYPSVVMAPLWAAL